MEPIDVGCPTKRLKRMFYEPTKIKHHSNVFCIGVPQIHQALKLGTQNLFRFWGPKNWSKHYFGRKIFTLGQRGFCKDRKITLQSISTFRHLAGKNREVHFWAQKLSPYPPRNTRCTPAIFLKGPILSNFGHILSMLYLHPLKHPCVTVL